MEVCAEGLVHDIPGWNPGPLLWTVALPINKVLEATTDTARIDEPSDREDRTTINDAGRRRGLKGRGMRR